MKHCPVCDQDKPLDAFYPKPRCPTCIECINARRRELDARRRPGYKRARANNNTGARGVVRVRRKCGITYRAQVKHDKHTIHLGFHKDVLDAICAASDYRIQHDLN